MEKEELEDLRDTMSSAEQAQLVGVLSSRVDQIVTAGTMTSAEGRAWIKGGWDCKQRAHIENLIDIIGSFVASGEDKQEKLEIVLDTNLLTVSEKSFWRSSFESSSYQNKDRVLRDCATEIERRQQAAISEVKQVETEALEQVPPTPESKAEELTEPAPEPVPEAAEVPDPKQVCLESVALYLSAKQFAEARKILTGSQTLFRLSEYTRLSYRIDKAELEHLGIYLQAA